jgi:membrane protein YdbS with pleckstrin-like domain
MYNTFCEFAERFLRIPPPPGHPPGDEQSTQIFHAAPNFYKYLLATWVLTTAILLVPAAALTILPIVGASALMKQGNNWGAFLFVISFLVLGGFIVTRLFALAVVRLDFEKRWYVVTDRSLRIREGIINVREMTVNFANIQNISISKAQSNGCWPLRTCGWIRLGAVAIRKIPTPITARICTPPFSEG